MAHEEREQRIELVFLLRVAVARDEFAETAVDVENRVALVENDLVHRAVCAGPQHDHAHGEGVAAVGFSKCASTTVTFVAAIMMALLGFFEPVQAFIASIPSCVIGGGTACILYGFISSSGVKLLKDVDLNNQKNLIICSVVLSLGISGVVLGGEIFSLSGTALALVTGIVLNLILKENKNEI